jgi:mono/diheme cytochrome c family protein
MTVIAAASNQLLAAVILSIAIIGFAIFLIISSFGPRKRTADVPAAMRPGPSDEELESRSLHRWMAWSVASVTFMAVFLPAYWLNEPNRIDRKVNQFTRESALRGSIIYQDEEFSEHLPGHPFFVANCARCHGKEGEGTIQPFREKLSYAEPPLAYALARYRAAGKNADDVRLIFRDAIERGRPGTLMPTWGLAFGGPLNEQQLQDVINYLLSPEFQKPFPKPDARSTGLALFQANCMVCHGSDANGDGEVTGSEAYSGGVGPNLSVVFQRLTRQEIFQTIHDGRINTNRPSMPAWAALDDPAINALVEFLRTIQRGAA